MLSNTAAIEARNTKADTRQPAKGRHRSVERRLNKRSIAGRRAAHLMAQLEAELVRGQGAALTDGQKLAVGRAAVMAAIAEDVRVRRLAGDTSISLEDLVRLDAASDRALRRLNLKAAPPKGPDLEEYLGSSEHETAAAPRPETVPAPGGDVITQPSDGADQHEDAA